MILCSQAFGTFRATVTSHIIATNRRKKTEGALASIQIRRRSTIIYMYIYAWHEDVYSQLPHAHTHIHTHRPTECARVIVRVENINRYSFAYWLSLIVKRAMVFDTYSTVTGRFFLFVGGTLRRYRIFEMVGPLL